ncbi:MAG: hypothetical protein ACOC44_20390 [Promethearchaeia archaeon]
MSYNEVDAPLKNVTEVDPESLADYDRDSVLFYDLDNKEFHYLHNVESSINFHSNKSKYYLFRIFSMLDDESSSEIESKIVQKYEELLERFGERL